MCLCVAGRSQEKSTGDTKCHQVSGLWCIRAGVHFGLSRGTGGVLESVQDTGKVLLLSAVTLQSCQLLFYCAQYFGVNIGPVHKRDVMKASVMLEHKKEWVTSHHYTCSSLALIKCPLVSVGMP